MTIDGIDIATFGLQESEVKNYFSIPSRKRVLEIPGFEAKDIVFEAKNITVSIFGIYDSKASLFSSIQSFNNHIKSSHIHEFYISEYDVTFNGVVSESVKVQEEGMAAILTIKIIIT